MKCAKFIVIEGGVTEELKGNIIQYYINPTDAREAGFEKPDSLRAAAPEPSSAKRVGGFCGLDEAGLRALEEEMGFAMSHDDMLALHKYFAEEEGRDPTVTELRAIDTYWSDHCRHTTFLTHLTDIGFEGDGEEGLAALVRAAFEEYLGLRREVYGEEKAAERPVTLMDLATIGAKHMKKAGRLDDLDESDEVNACCIKVRAEMVKGPGAEPVLEDWLVYFKNETHNHPTEIEPFGGASTCLGGGIRDPLSGRSYVYQAMRITGCGNPHTALRDTLPGKLTQYQITRTAARGYSSYGNQIGAASGLVSEIYDEDYVAKRMELGALFGAAPAANVIREQPVPGDVILLIGGRTGRDGVGAATGSSKEQSEEALQTAGAEVQKGNPSIERNIVRLFRRPEATRLIKRCNDFGAGGVSVAIGELAPGLDVDLDKVRTKYDGMDGTELALSESQERMAVVVSRDDAAALLACCAEENIEAAEVAKVTDTERFRMYWRGERIFDISRKFLDSNGAVHRQKLEVREKDIALWGGPNSAKNAAGADGMGGADGAGGVDGATGADGMGDFGNNNSVQDFAGKADLLAMLSDLACADQRGLIEYFDASAGAGTLLMPLGGKNQLTPAVGMAAKLPVLSGDTNTATLMAYGFDPKIAKASAFHGGLYAVLDSAAKIAAMGGDAEGIRLSFQEFFPSPGAVPSRWASPFMALLGALKAQTGLGAPSVGGKDSMSGTFRHIDVPPTLVSFAVRLTDARTVLSPEFKKAGSKIVLLDCPRDARAMPDFEVFKQNAKRVFELNRDGKILAANTVPYGGLFVSAAKMAIGNDIGAVLYSGSKQDLLCERYGALLLEVDGVFEPERLFAGLPCRVVGETTDSRRLEIPETSGGAAISVSLAEIAERLEAPLAAVFPTEAHPDFETDGVPAVADRAIRGAAVSSFKLGAAKPRVFIPVFPGTNCEVESKRAFERAGAEVCLTNLLPMNAATLEDSCRRLADEIKKSQIVMLAGGYSGGDEPEGSAKFMEAVFRSPYIAEAVTELLESRDGLVLGICTGFQALLKLGLLPYGRITELGAQTEGAPALACNTLGRHTSRLVRARVCSVLSPWLALSSVGDIHTLPVSCGEGRFVCGAETVKELAAKGQITTQYVDLSGAPSYDLRFNPGGSMLAVEGLSSPDGRVFGRTGHAERCAQGLYLNVPGAYDEGMFAAGVGYFK